MGDRLRTKKGAWRTVFVLGSAQFVDLAELNVLSATFPSIKRSLGLDVGHLGAITGAKELVQLICGPLWSMAADRFSRKGVLVWGTGVWGAWTLFIGFVASYRQLLVLTLLSGVGLVAFGNPVGSLISDLFPREKRGKALGTIWAVAFTGALLALLGFGRLVEVHEMGWRIVCWVFGALSVLSGVLVWLFVEEPVRGQAEDALADVIDEVGSQAEARYRFRSQEVLALFRVPTLLLQWLATIPTALRSITMASFFVTWLAEDRGFSPGAATSALTPWLAGNVIGNVVGGFLGDWADRRSAGHGRIVVGQLSALAAALVSYLLFQVRWDSAAPYWLLSSVLGLLGAVGGTGVMVPIRLAVTLPEVRATGAAIGTTVASIVAALGNYLVGRLGATMGLTATFFWTATVACAVQVLIGSAFHPVYHRDAARMQRALVDRRAELIADHSSG